MTDSGVADVDICASPSRLANARCARVSNRNVDYPLPRGKGRGISRIREMSRRRARRRHLNSARAAARRMKHPRGHYTAAIREKGASRHMTTRVAIPVERAETRPPLPPFTRDTAIQKVRAAEDGWNTRDPERVALAYNAASRWRNRAEFVVGREQIVAFLRRKWARELDYRLIKELWAFEGSRIAVRFA